VLRVPKTTLKFGDFLGKLTRYSKYMGMVYYGKSIHNKHNKEKQHMGKVQIKVDARF
jgi:hypothetical protein